VPLVVVAIARPPTKWLLFCSARNHGSNGTVSKKKMLGRNSRRTRSCLRVPRRRWRVRSVPASPPGLVCTYVKWYVSAGKRVMCAKADHIILNTRAGDCQCWGHHGTPALARTRQCCGIHRCYSCWCFRCCRRRHRCNTDSGIRSRRCKPPVGARLWGIMGFIAAASYSNGADRRRQQCSAASAATAAAAGGGLEANALPECAVGPRAVATPDSYRTPAAAAQDCRSVTKLVPLTSVLILY
jgi:hypothetical protein